MAGEYRSGDMGGTMAAHNISQSNSASQASQALLHSITRTWPEQQLPLLNNWPAKNPRLDPNASLRNLPNGFPPSSIMSSLSASSAVEQQLNLLQSLREASAKRYPINYHSNLPSEVREQDSNISLTNQAADHSNRMAAIESVNKLLSTNTFGFDNPQIAGHGSEMSFDSSNGFASRDQSFPLVPSAFLNAAMMQQANSQTSRPTNMPFPSVALASNNKYDANESLSKPEAAAPNLLKMLMSCKSLEPISEGESTENTKTPTIPDLQRIENSTATNEPTGSIQVKKESDLCMSSDNNKELAQEETKKLVDESEHSDDSTPFTTTQMGGPTDFSDILSEQALEQTTNNNFSCNFCDFEIDEKHIFEAHVRSEHPNACTNCNYTTEDSTQFLEHQKNCSSSNNQATALTSTGQEPTKGGKKWICKICKIVCYDETARYTHQREHIPADKLLECRHCPFVTKYKHHFDYHEKNHNGDKPFKCKQCPYACVNKSMLNSHMKSHSNFYSYRCKNCNYEAKYMHALKCHCRKYGHEAQPVLNPDGTINPYPVIDIYGTRRGPKVKRDAEGKVIMPSASTLLPQSTITPQYTATIEMQPTKTDISSSPLTSSTSNLTNINGSPPSSYKFPSNLLYNYHDTPPGPSSLPAFPGLERHLRASNFNNQQPSYLNSPQSPLTSNIYDSVANFMKFAQQKPESLKQEVPSHAQVKCFHCPASFITVELMYRHMLMAHFVNRNNPIASPDTPLRPSIRRNEDITSNDFYNRLQANISNTSNPPTNITECHESMEDISTTTPIVSDAVKPQEKSTVSSSPGVPLDLTKDHTPPQQIIRRRPDSPQDVSPSSLTPPDTCSPPKKARYSDHIAANRRLEDISENPSSKPADQSVQEEIERSESSGISELDKEEGSPEKANSPELNFPMDCEHCGITFRSKTMHSTHMSYHDVSDPQKCTFCQEAFTDFNKFYDHCYTCRNR